LKAPERSHFQSSCQVKKNLQEDESVAKFTALPGRSLRSFNVLQSGIRLYVQDSDRSKMMFFKILVVWAIGFSSTGYLILYSKSTPYLITDAKWKSVICRPSVVRSQSVSHPSVLERNAPTQSLKKFTKFHIRHSKHSALSHYRPWRDCQ
jgi:hypothetical protein